MQNGQGTFGAALIRSVDILASAVLLALFSPFFLAITILIKLDSSGPIFFLQERVGRGWCRFRMFKFRKMAHGGKSTGPGITARFDPRVTRVGSWLERTKLDELPQLINVLLGHMSLVGPRPEIPRFTGEPYTELWNKVLEVKPGLFGPNQITHRNEAELFPSDCQEVEAYYVEHILPRKLEVDAGYAARKSLFYDVWIVLCGVWVSLTGTITKDTIRTRRWQIAHLLTCVALGEITLIAAFLLRFDWSVPAREIQHLQYGLLLMAAARLIAFHQFAIHRSVHAFFNLFDAMRICSSVAVGTVLGIAAQILLNFRTISRSIFVVDGLMLAVTLIAISYLGDRILAAVHRRKALARSWLRAYVCWGFVAGLAGVAAMLYALVFVWPDIFDGHSSELLCILAVVFCSRAALFPFLARRLPASMRVAEVLTADARPIIRHCILAFVVDITAVFFLNIRDFSRAAIVANGIFYAILLILLLAVRSVWGRKFRAAAAAADSEQDGPDRILIVGDGREVGYLVDSLRHGGADKVELAGIVTANPDVRAHRIHGAEIVGTTRNLKAVLGAKSPSLVMVLEDSIDEKTLAGVMDMCRACGVDTTLVPSIMHFVGTRNGNGSRAERIEGSDLETSTIETR